jgi:hypothetical protein
MQTINIFPKTLRFFTQVNDVYVKIYETAQLCFLNQQTNIHVNFANVLWVAFSIPSGSLSLHNAKLSIFKLFYSNFQLLLSLIIGNYLRLKISISNLFCTIKNASEI